METTEKEEKILAFMDKILPHVKISPLRAGDERKVISVKYFISPSNHDLSKSQYFYEKKINFAHFTNLKAVRSIISERVIRLYNLNNLNDPREYSFAGDLIFFNYKNKEDAKENIYILALCEEEILTKNKTEIEFNLWRLYGNDGFGVVIIFSFEGNPPINWKDYFLSAVQYGSKARAKLNEFRIFHKKLEMETPHTLVDLGQIVCFHKSKLYSLEQEIRLLFDNRDKNNFSSTNYYDSQNNLTSPLIRTDFTKSKQLKKPIKFLELPIYHKDFEPVSFDNKIPIPVITKIILGYQYKKVTSITENLQRLCMEKLGYLPSIEESRLTKYYHDK